MSEKEMRDKAVDVFANEIKMRLDEQAAKGYTGWDGAYPAKTLCREIAGDANDVHDNLPFEKYQTTCNHVMGFRAVDMGARAMMLHFRSLPQQEKEEVR